MAETTTETATTQTEAASSSQTATSTTETATTASSGTTLVTGTEAKQEQAASEKEQSKSEETKTEETKTDGEKKTEETKTDGAPDKYEFKDADKFDSQVIGAFSEAAKEANLTQDAAQNLLDKVAPALQARQEEQVKAVHQQWTDASTADKEFGGEHLKENLGVAKRALDQFGSPELRTFLDQSGLGNHPEVIRLLYRAGKAISEDTIVTGGSKNTAAKPEDVFYPTMVEKK